MTRPRCPQCHKYYVTLIPEKRPLTVRATAAVNRSIRHTPPIAPRYRRYQCDICGHHWVASAAATTIPSAGPSFATRVMPAQSPRLSPAAAPRHSLPFEEAIPPRRPARQGTLMAAQRQSRPLAGAQSYTPPARKSSTQNIPRTQMHRSPSASSSQTTRNAAPRAATPSSASHAVPLTTLRLAAVDTIRSRWQDSLLQMLPAWTRRSLGLAS